MFCNSHKVLHARQREHMQRLQKEKEGNYASSHLSIFPHQTLAEAWAAGPTEHSVNSEQVLFGDVEEVFVLPGNLAHYMRKELAPDMRFNPPARFKKMMLGKLPIPLEFNPSGAQVLHTGWVDYAHPDGTVYSGMYNGGAFDYVNTFSVPEQFAGRLIECLNHNDPSLASNCSQLSPGELRDMDAIAMRTEWLFQVAGMRSHATDDDINAALATPEQKEHARNFFGEGNSLPVLTNPLRFQPPASA